MKAIKAGEVIPTSIPEEAYDAFRLAELIGEPPIYEEGGKAYIVLEISRGISAQHLLACVAEYVRTYHVPKALTIRPEGGGSYARKFQADLNALTAHILLQTLKPSEATAVTSELLQRHDKRGLYTGDKEWKAAAERGGFLIRKTKEGQFDVTLLSEQLDSFLNVRGSTQS